MTELAEITVVDGAVFVVEGSVEDVEKKLSDAARSGQSRLAWFNEEGRDVRMGINPAHVVALRVAPTGT